MYEPEPYDLFTEDFFNDQFGYIRGAYLDHAGAALYPRGLVTAVSDDLLCGNLYRNPHSSINAANILNDIRLRILQFFNTNQENYSVIFTSGATEAMKIVADSFNYSGNFIDVDGNLREPGTRGELVYLQQNHTSVLGMRNVDNIKRHNVPVRSVSQEYVNESIVRRYTQQREQAFDVITRQQLVVQERREMREIYYRGHSLFVYPAQCNFSGYKYPMLWVNQVQTGVLETNPHNPARWFCFLDAAAFVSTSELNLTVEQPDFICISFYKIFGLPTGLGALIVRNTSAFTLHKKYFGGGTVQIAMASTPVVVPKAALHERFEDGTVNFHAIIAVGHALNWLQNSGLNMPMITDHCHRLAQYLYHKLREIRHHNLMPAVVIYAQTHYENSSSQGPIVNFNLLRDNGSVLGFNTMVTLAEVVGISLRVGCFCNPGACQRYLQLSDEEYFRFHSEAGHVCGDNIDMVGLNPTGSIRVSIGLYTRKRDLDVLINSISQFVRSLPPPALYALPNEVVDIFPVDENQQVLDENGEPRPQMPPQLYHLNPNMRLTQITVYPIKSCRGMQVNSWTLGSRGLLYDRYWMIVNASGTAYTLKNDSNLCRIQPFVDLERGILIIHCEGYRPCSVPLHIQQNVRPLNNLRMCRSRVCGDLVVGIDCGEEVSIWLSTVLRQPGLRLVRQNEEAERLVTTGGGASSSLALSNQSQYLMINENSVTSLWYNLPNRQAYSENDLIKRFRSNFVFAGNCPSLQEEHWGRVVIGNADFLVSSVCNRCMVITMDPMTGERNNDVFVTLHNHRRGRPRFGIYLTALNLHEVVVRVGDRITPTLK